MYTQGVLHFKCPKSPIFREIRENVSFVYTEPFFNHFKFRHQVDDHNNARHSPISLEKSVNTKDWKIRVFTFFLAVVEVNARLAHSVFFSV
jgi:hypothetical protein